MNHLKLYIYIYKATQANAKSVQASSPSQNMAKKLTLLLLAILLLQQASSGESRSITNDLPLSMVSDGVLEKTPKPNSIWLPGSLFSSDSCDQTYGFLPCTTTVLGNTFLIIVYGYLMFLSAKLLSNGSEILLQILGPGIVGGFFLPLLSSIPDATIILGKLSFHQPSYIIYKAS